VDACPHCYGRKDVLSGLSCGHLLKSLPTFGPYAEYAGQPSSAIRVLIGLDPSTMTRSRTCFLRCDADVSQSRSPSIITPTTSVKYIRSYSLRDFYAGVLRLV
jgi:hypothetical protein